MTASVPRLVSGRRWAPGVVLLLPGVVWLVGRVVGVGVLAVICTARGRSVDEVLTSWDGQYNLRIAERGYGAAGDMAFFPGYPTLVRWVSAVLGVGRTPAALAITALSGIALAYGLWQLMMRVSGGSPAAGLILVALVGSSPLSVVFIMSYPEAVFCSIATWGLVAVLDRSWGLAAVAAVAAGLVRPTGAALVFVVVVGAAVAGWRTHGAWRWRYWCCAAAAPAGLVGYLMFVAVRTGHLDGYLRLQTAGWHTRFDGGKSTALFVLGQFVNPWSLMEVATVLVLLSLPPLIAIAVRARLPWPLLMYGLLVVAMSVLSSGVINSRMRMLLPALPLLIPVAVGLSRRRSSTQLAVLSGATLAAAWFGAYCLTIYPYAI